MLAATVRSLLALPAFWGGPGYVPESEAEYRDRLTILALAADEASSDVSWRYGRVAMRRAILAVWYGETRFELAVHRGEPGRWGSDKGLSKCLGQIHKSVVPGEVWRSLGGTSLEATTRCALVTAEFLSRSAYCSEFGPASVFEAYGRGRCTTPTVRSWRKARWLKQIR